MRPCTEKPARQANDSAEARLERAAGQSASDELGRSSERMPSELIAAMSMVKRAGMTIEQLLEPSQVQGRPAPDQLMVNALHVATSVGIAHNLLPALAGLRTALADKAAACKAEGRTSARLSILAHLTRLDLARDGIAQALPAVHGLTVIDSVAKTLSEALGLPFFQEPDDAKVCTSLDTLLKLHAALKCAALVLMDSLTDMPQWAQAPAVSQPEREALTMVCCQVMGNDVSLSVGAATAHLEGRSFMPGVAHNLLQSIRLLSDATTVFTDYFAFDDTLIRERVSRGLANSLMLETSRCAPR